MINVPDHVQNEAAYVAAAYRRIAKNAMKTTMARVAAEPEFRAVINMIEAKGMNAPKETFFGSLYAAFKDYGKISAGQEAAVLKIIAKDAERKAAARLADAGSVFVGTVGKREDFTLTLTGEAQYDSMYGTQYLHFFKDAAGNVVIYKGSKKLAVAKGEEITFKATVKAHDERDGVKQTSLSRPA
jgi:hypothetical protein